MSILLYHGSNQYFEQVDLDKTRGFLDFGKGFYLTTYLEQAQEWALRKLRSVDTSTRAYIYEYQFDSDHQDELNILELLDYDKRWFDFIMEARSSQDTGIEYDLIYDKMADGHLEEIIRQYKGHKISWQKALKLLQFSSDRDQYCFKSPKALSTIRRLRYADVCRNSRNECSVKWHTVGGIINE